MNKSLSVFLFSLFMLFSMGKAHAEAPIYTSFFSSKAVGGYDTVAYFTEGKPVKGKKAFSTRYKGADWFFSNEENLNAFQQAPEKYAPQYGGYCAWAIGHNKFAKGDPQHWSIEDGKLYLNYDASVKKQWLDDKQNLITEADKNWPTLIK